MKKALSPGLNGVIEARSVKTFVRRVHIIFAALLLLGGCIMCFLIYLPLNNALEASLIHSFGQIFEVNYLSYQNNVQRGLEGARVLSSRITIKLAMEEYDSGGMSLGELMAYCQPKYEDGAAALEHLVLAQRSVGDVVIARYAPSPKHPMAAGFAQEVLPRGAETQLQIRLWEDRVYAVILSPVMDGNRLLGHDRLVLDFTDYFHLLCTDTVQTALLDDKAYRTLTRGTKIIGEGSGALMMSAPDWLIAATSVQGDLHFVLKQEKLILFAPIHRLGLKIFLVGITTLTGFLITVYFYVVRYAKQELGALEVSHLALEKVASEVNIDTLTQAGSRRYGAKILGEAFADFQAGGASPLVMMFDVDCLKHINDSLGHDVGDLVLQQVASAAYRAIRSKGKLFRWGGDEFTGIFYGVKEESSLPLANEILDAVLSVNIDVENERLNPTISMGISYFNETDTEYADALKRADQAMYQSKAEGRNRVNRL